MLGWFVDEFQMIVGLGGLGPWASADAAVDDGIDEDGDDGDNGDEGDDGDEGDGDDEDDEHDNSNNWRGR